MIVTALSKILPETQESIYVVDIAASNGVSQSPVLPFFKSGSAGLAVEVDGEKFGQLSYLYSNFPLVTLVKTRVAPEIVAPLLKQGRVPKYFEVLNVDIDSFDLDLAVAVLSADYRPSLISIEINEKIPPLCILMSPSRANTRGTGDTFTVVP